MRHSHGLLGLQPRLPKTCFFLTDQMMELEPFCPECFSRRSRVPKQHPDQPQVHKSYNYSHHPTKPVDDSAQRFQNRTCGRLPQHGHKLTVPCTTSSMARRSAMLGERGAWVLTDQFKTTNVARTIGRQSRTTGQYGPASSTDGHKCSLKADELVIATAPCTTVHGE